MNAVQILGDASSPYIATNDSIPRPIPQGAEILIRVLASGVTGDEVLWPEVYKTASRIPGHEICGIIEALGPDFDGPLVIGQDVVALIAADRGGGQAEYTICFADEVAVKPASASLTHGEAAALPIPALTAWQGLMDHGRLAAGMRVLVTGAAGAVGQLAVQLATKVAGAHVIALASHRSHGALRQLGVCEVHDYNDPDWERNIDGVDLVFDTVGGDVLAKTWETVKSDGTIVTVGDPAPKWAFERSKAATESVSRPDVQYMYFIVRPESERLSQVLDMIGKGLIKKLDVDSFPFGKAQLAWECAKQKKRRSKKIVITF